MNLFRNFEGINLSYLNSLPAGARVLDYGCGSGLVSRFLVTRGFRVVAADVDRSCEQSVRSKISKTDQSRLQFVLIGEDDFLPEQVGKFQAIICREVLEHVPDPGGVLHRFGEFLVEGGLLVLSVPSAFSERFFSFCESSWLQYSEHLHIFGRDEIRMLLRDSGLFLAGEEGQSFRWTLFWSLLVPFRVKHRMGIPVTHRRLAHAAQMIIKMVCFLPGVERVGNRLFPKSYFFYAMKRKPRVLVVFDYQDWVLGNWAEEIRKVHGDAFDVVTMSVFHALKDPVYAARVASKVDIFHLLLVHAFHPFQKLIRGKAVVGTIHHWVEWGEPFSSAAKLSHHMITGAQEWANRLEEKGLPSERITVIHSGVKDCFFEDRPPLLPKSPKLTCGFFAKMESNEVDRKGTRHLLRLAEFLSNAGLSDEFRMVITGPGWQTHVEAMQRGGIETVYLPYVDEPDMPALFRSMDVYLMLSDVEGGPVTVAEAMASGCLVFSTPVGVAKELVQDQVTGRVVDTADIADIVAKLLEHRANPASGKAIVERASRLAREKMRYQDIMFPLAKLYRDVLRFVERPGEGHLDAEVEELNTRAHAARVGGTLR